MCILRSSKFAKKANPILPFDIEVVVSICMFNIFMCPLNILLYRFYLIYSCTCLELFLKVQSMKVQNLAKYEWLLNMNRNGYILQTKIVVYND